MTLPVKYEPGARRRADSLRPAAQRAGSALAVGYLGLAALVGGVGLWAGAVELSGAVIAQGKIAVAAQRQVVQHAEGGVVAEILARDGDLVEAGEPLLRLDGAAALSELAIVDADRFEAWARMGRLRAEQEDLGAPRFDADLEAAASADPAVADILAGQRRLLAAQNETLRQEARQLTERQAQIDAEIGGFEAERAATQTQRRLIDDELRDQRALFDKGLAPVTRVLALERAAAELDGRLGALQSRAAQALGRRAEIEVEKLRIGSGRREEATDDLRRTAAEFRRLSERRAALLETLSRLELRAPRSGVVIESIAHAPRMVIRPAEPVLFIVPRDDRLVVEASIAPREIDRVHPGQEAVLRFPAFEAEKTPEVAGVVAQISGDAIDAAEPGQEPFYRARIDLPAAALRALGDRTLTPGMPAEVFLKTDARSPLSFIAKPAIDYFERAFRER